jgi:hypothetical protein
MIIFDAPTCYKFDIKLRKQVVTQKHTRLYYLLMPKKKQ